MWFQLKRRFSRFKSRSPVGRKWFLRATSEPGDDTNPYPVESPLSGAMGLFEKAGRRFEQFKREAKAAAEEEAEYECAACEARLYTAQARCPECGADEIVPVGRGDDEQR